MDNDECQAYIVSIWFTVVRYVTTHVLAVYGASDFIKFNFKNIQGILLFIMLYQITLKIVHQSCSDQGKWYLAWLH